MQYAIAPGGVEIAGWTAVRSFLTDFG